MESKNTKQPTPSSGKSGAKWSALYEIFVALRILRARKRRSVSVMTGISVAGIILGVAALVIVLGITGGFQDAFRDRILGLHPHLIVYRTAGEGDLQSPDTFFNYREVAQTIRKVDGVAGVSPSTFQEMLIARGSNRSGVALKGIDLDSVETVIPVGEALIKGDLASLDEKPTLEIDGDRISVSSPVIGSSWTLAAVAGNNGQVGVSLVLDEGERSSAGRSFLRILHLSKGVGAFHVSVDGGEPALLNAGDATQALPLIPGRSRISFQELDGHRKETASIFSELGEDALLAVVPGDSSAMEIISLEPGGHFSGDLRVDESGDVTGRGRVRLINTLERPIVLVVDGDEVGVDAGETSDFLFVEGRLPGMILGAELQRKLGVSMGENVTVVSTLHSLARDGGDVEQGPINGLFRVVGVFQSGYYEYDSTFSLVNFRSSQRLLDQGDVVQWLEVSFDDVIQVRERADAIEALINPYGLGTFNTSVNDSYRSLEEDVVLRELSGEKPEDVLAYLRNVSVAMDALRRQSKTFGYQPRYGTVDWEERNKNLFNALKLQKAMVTIFILLIIAVAAFNMVGSQVMMVHDKREEIAILKTMGASSRGIMTIFLLQGAIIAAMGTAIGLILGVGACWMVDSIGYPLDPEVYFIDKLPVRLDGMATVLVGVMTLVFTTLSTLYSARRAARLPPALALRQLD